LISAGFDSARGDVLGQINVSPVGFAWMTHGLRKIQSKTVAILEGGYSLIPLAESSEAMVRVLMHSPTDENAFDRIITSYNNKGFGKYKGTDLY